MVKATKQTETSSWRVGGVFAAAIGLALTGLGVFLLLSFLTGDVALDPAAAAKTCWTGLLGAWMAFGGIHTFGRIPALVLAVLMICWGIRVLTSMRFLATWPAVFGGALIVVAASLGSCAFADSYDMNSGGLLAVYVSPPAILYFGRWGLVLAAAGVLVLGILLAFGETAVAVVHQALFCLRDMAIGLYGLAGRLRELFKLLFSPRLAVAGGDIAERMAGRRLAPSAKPGESRPGPAERKAPEKAAPDFAAADEPAAAAAEPEADTDAEPETLQRKNLREWKPRGGFKSRFLDLDFRDDSATAASEPVQAAIAPQPRPDDFGRKAPDVIMDVDAQAEEADEAAIEDVAPEMEEVEDIPVAVPTGFAAGLEIEPEPEPEFDLEPEPEPEPPPPPPPLPKARPARVEQPRPRPVSATTPRPAPAARMPATAEAEPAEYRLPPLELLDPPEPPVVDDDGEIEFRAHLLEQTLAEFKIAGKVVNVERGPRVTRYELCLARGIKVNKVTSLADNIAMQLQAQSVRIIAPIPGKNTIGIEIPNINKELVSLKEIVESVCREKRAQALPVCLGKDVSGLPLVADLARMPHLLIAGATGSGKSVCINSIIMSIMMCCRPDEAQLIMVDPKVVELSRFKDIPHLMSPVITDMKRAVAVLEWICQKMDERYEQMSQVSVNNIAKFNALGEEGIRSRLDAFASLEEIEAFPKKMPYMVVIIDELADLMMVAGKEVELHITRLAAKSRAVGIHLILATQRPSVDVITGLIKANMPCRIAFQVASRVDSRTILDGNGAEDLLGAGDMLYLPPGVGKLTRAQGVFVSDEELFRVVDFTKAEAEPQYHSDLLGPVIGGGATEVDISEFDELFLQSGEAIIQNQRGSVSLLQRKFGIGYGRASRIIDQLASVGLLGPFRDGKAREILLNTEEFRSKFGGAGGGGSSWDDEDGDGTVAGLRDDEREPAGAPWEDEDDEA